MSDFLEVRKYISHNINYENESSNNEEELAMRALWRSVLTQALMDAANKSKKKTEKISKMKAIQWLLEDNHDFTEVCRLADMEPDYVRAQAKAALSRGCKWRNDERSRLLAAI